MTLTRFRWQASASGSPAIAAWSAPRYRAPACERGLRDPDRRHATKSICSDQARGRDLDARANKPDAVFLAAAKVGGILANDTYPADFLYDNLMIEANVIEAAHRDRRREAAVSRLVLHLSEVRAAADPRGGAADRAARADQRMVRHRQDRRHQAVPGLSPAVRLRFHFGHADQSLRAGRQFRPGHQPRDPGADPQGARGEDPQAPKIEIWGTGTPRREFLHVDDCADALVHLMKSYSDDRHVNVGSGSDLTIQDLAELIRDIVGFGGRIVHDASRPDGVPRKLLSSDRLTALGWLPRIDLREGLRQTYAWFVANTEEQKRRTSSSVILHEQ